MAVKHKIGQFDAASLEATKDYWREQVGSTDDFVGIYQRKFDWAEGRIDYDNSNDEFAYGIFREDNSAADAIMHVVYSHAGRRWVKMLNMDLAPRLDYSFADEDPDGEEISSVFSAAIIGVQRITQYHPTTTAKLYGRSSVLLGFLRGFAVHFNEAYSDNEHVSVDVEGRWLVIKERKA